MMIFAIIITEIVPLIATLTGLGGIGFAIINLLYTEKRTHQRFLTSLREKRVEKIQTDLTEVFRHAHRIIGFSDDIFSIGDSDLKEVKIRQDMINESLEHISQPLFEISFLLDQKNEDEKKLTEAVWNLIEFMDESRKGIYSKPQKTFDRDKLRKCVEKIGICSQKVFHEWEPPN